MNAKELLIVWCSTTGASQQVAYEVEQGARSTPVVPLRLHANQADPAAVLRCAAMVIITPEHLGSMAGEMKSFFDRAYYPLLGCIEGKPYALVVTGGSDGQPTVKQVQRIVTGWRMREVAPALIVNTQAQSVQAILAPKTLTSDQKAQAFALGEALGHGLDAGVF